MICVLESTANDEPVFTKMRVHGSNDIKNSTGVMLMVIFIHLQTAHSSVPVAELCIIYFTWVTRESNTTDAMTLIFEYTCAHGAERHR